jgi:hypothetical protein
VLVHWVGGVVHPLVVVHHTQQVVVIRQPCGCMYSMAWCIDTGEQTATSITLLLNRRNFLAAAEEALRSMWSCPTTVSSKAALRR